MENFTEYNDVVAEDNEFFGVHLTVDAFEANVEKLWDEAYIEQFIRSLVIKAEMLLVGGPYTINYSGLIPEDAGVTSLGILAESTVSLHGFPHRNGFVSIDLYSCKVFNKDEIVDFIKDAFDIKDAQVNFFKRGVGFKR